MERVKRISKRTKSVLKSIRDPKPLYLYKKDGIYAIWGPLEGKNLSKMYQENPEILERFFENIFDADEVPIKMLMTSVDVYTDLKTNYYNY